MNQQAILTRVDPETKKQWQALARSQGKTESELTRELVIRILQRAPEPPESDAEGETLEVVLKLKRHEMKAVEKAAAAMGWKRNTWIVAVIRSVVFKEPRLTDQEARAVMRGCSELLAIGRNLNQIARAMQTPAGEQHELTPELVQNLRAQIQAHVQDAGRLIEAAEQRWKPAHA